MEFAFYFASGIAVVSTLRVITNTNPVHALLYLIISLIAVAMTFFALGAPFAGVLEVIAYAGAIMVLFVFVVMMLNLGPASVAHNASGSSPASGSAQSSSQRCCWLNCCMCCSLTRAARPSATPP